MKITKFTLPYFFDNRSQYFFIYRECLNSKSIVYGPIESEFIRDDIAQRIADYQGWLNMHSEDSPLIPDALYIYEGDLINYR